MKTIKKLKNGRIMICDSYWRFTEEITPLLIDQLFNIIFDHDEWKKLYNFYNTEEKQKELEQKILKIKYEFEQKKYDDLKFNHQFDKLLEDKYAFRLFGSIFLFLFMLLIMQLILILIFLLK